MLPTIEAIQKIERYSTLVHLKARVENMLADAKVAYTKAADASRERWHSAAGRKARLDLRGVPYCKREPDQIEIDVQRTRDEVHDLGEIAAVILARMREVSPPPVNDPKKIRLYDEPWHG